MRTNPTTGASPPDAPAPLEALEVTLADLPGSWSCDVLKDEGTGLSALLMPEDGDRFAAAVLLEQVDGEWKLTGHRWDRFQTVVTFGDLAGALNHLRGIAKEAAQAGGSARLN